MLTLCRRYLKMEQMIVQRLELSKRKQQCSQRLEDSRQSIAKSKVSINEFLSYPNILLRLAKPDI
jgi:hypothetical protein